MNQVDRASELTVVIRRDVCDEVRRRVVSDHALADTKGGHRVHWWKSFLRIS
jgi:hypothetical protein